MQQNATESGVKRIASPKIMLIAINWILSGQEMSQAFWERTTAINESISGPLLLG